VNVLALNCGSSSLKTQVLAMAADGAVRARPARGAIERIGEGQALVTLETATTGPTRVEERVTDHAAAVERVLDWLAATGLRFDAVAHRVVHGGPRYTQSAVIDERVIGTLSELEELAPLHNGPSVTAIRAARRRLGPSLPMVAVFDTTFHATLPDHARAYAIPRELALRHGVRRFGFHGTSFRHVLARYGELASVPPARARLVALHLGNGCSAVAIAEGRSVDTSMGLTPLEGLVMGTRSGDLDPAAVGHLARGEGAPVEEVERRLNEESGLLGLSGLSKDMRDLLARASEDPRARLAVEVFCYRARKYVGAYLAALGGAEALVFTGAMGERAPEVRARICGGLEWFGLVLDPEANWRVTDAEARISPAGARVAVWVIPTDEEAVMAADAAALLGGSGPA
jgi:acetate kinase